MTVEKRTFINKDKYNELVNYFKSNSTLEKNFNQIIYKYKSDLDFRLIFDSNNAYLRLRGVVNHNDDIVIDIKKEQIKDLTVVLRNLGMYEETKWYRHRAIYKLNDYTITLDETYQYGYIISISKPISDIEQLDSTHQELENLFNKFHIKITTKEEFNDRYKYYKLHWVDVLQTIDEDKFISKQYE